MTLKSNSFLFVISCVFCITAAETFFYVFAMWQYSYPAVWYHTDEDNTKLLCYDKNFLSVADWDLKSEHPFPNLRYAANTDNDSSLQDLPFISVPNAIVVTINEVGFRERPVAQLNSRNKVTLVIGDSFGAGQGVRVQDRFTEVLEAKLLEDGTNHAVGNFCMMGHNVRAVSKTLSQNIDVFPNLQRVIYMMTLNDPVGDAKALEMYQVVDDLMHLRTNVLLSRTDLPLVRWSHTAKWVGQLIVRYQISRQTEERYQYLFSENAGWKQTTEIIDRMKKRCELRDVEFALVLFPLLHRLKEYPFVKAHSAVREYAQRAGIDFYDLLEVFSNKIESRYWVHPRDFHPNYQAHREVAEYLHTKINW